MSCCCCCCCCCRRYCYSYFHLLVFLYMIVNFSSFNFLFSIFFCLIFHFLFFPSFLCFNHLKLFLSVCAIESFIRLCLWNIFVVFDFKHFSLLILICRAFAFIIIDYNCIRSELLQKAPRIYNCFVTLFCNYFSSL